ncbi:MAG: hypothetical protein WCV88_05590 [Patescibacteria group bacterium]|jgi:hypothetical protein
MPTHFGLTPAELKILNRLSTPIKIQNYLDAVPMNWEKHGETYMSPRRVLREKKMHCLEGALLAATALWLQHEPALLLDLRAKGDDDHVVTLYKRHGYWGAISKTNHASLRFRDPIYKTLRELVLSYFHEYFSDTTGKKVLHDYSSKPFNLKTRGSAWITTEENLFSLVTAIDEAAHTKIVPDNNLRFIRQADTMERRAGLLREWTRSNPLT